MYSVTDKMQEKYVELLCDICKIETPTENKAQIDKMSELIEKFAIASGYVTERIPFDEAGDFVIVKSEGDESLAPVLLMAHMDTVHKIGAFGEKIVHLDGDWMYGPGVMDCKGGIATGLCVMELMKKENRCKRPIYLLLTSDEEVSGRLSGEKGFDIMKSLAKSSCAVFNLEAGMPEEVTVSRKGILKVSVEVTGIPAHAGNAYFEGASAIREAANLILKIEALSKKNGPTFNCGIISGGTTINTVPEKCTFAIDIRVSSMDEMEMCKKHIYDIASKPETKGTKCEVKIISVRPPMECTEKNIELLNKWNLSAKALGMNEFKGITKGGGSDAAYTVIAGAPTLCSCAIIGYNAHGREEKVNVGSLKERAALLCHIIESLEDTGYEK